MRNGSSENVISESLIGVLNTFAFRSLNPSKGSISVPILSFCREIAIALTVKSLRCKSSLISVIIISFGLRDFGSYDSNRAEATSISHSLYGIRAVANFGNGTTVDTFNFFPN